MRTLRAASLLVLGLSLLSCREHERRAFDSAVDAAEADVAAHQRTVDKSASMAVAQGEIDRHAAEIDADVRIIRSRLLDFDGWCDDDDLDWVWDSVNAIEDRIAVYLLDAGQVSELTALRSVAGRYQLDMNRLLDEARDRLDDTRCW